MLLDIYLWGLEVTLKFTLCIAAAIALVVIYDAVEAKVKGYVNRRTEPSPFTGLIVIGVYIGILAAWPIVWLAVSLILVLLFIGWIYGIWEKRRAHRLGYI